MRELRGTRARQKGKVASRGGLYREFRLSVAKLRTLANNARFPRNLGYGVRMATYSSTVRAAETSHDHPYVLASITQTASPHNPGEPDWHRYVINQGGNQIVGYRRGNPQSVRQEVDGIVVQLNARRTIKSGRKHITIGTTNKKTSG
jgi:hypothetical protein